MEVFQDYAYYYNAFYKDKDYKAEAATIDNLLKKYSPGTHDIINFGCGTGRHDIELNKMGYRCRGIDVSTIMIDIAKKNALDCGMELDFETADVRSYVARRKYDAVISLFHVMSYQNKNTDVLDVLYSARKALNKDGMFLFDVWYGSGVLSDKPCVRVKEIDEENNRLIRIARPVMHEKENIVDVNYEVLVIDKASHKVRTINEIHKMRYFFRPELEMLLDKTGFKLIDNIDCVTLQDTDYNSWTSYFIAKAV